MTARGTGRRTPFSMTRTRPVRSVTSIRVGEVNAIDQGTSRPVTTVSALSVTASFVFTIRLSGGVSAAPRRRSEVIARVRTRNQGLPRRLPFPISWPGELGHPAPESLPGFPSVRDPVLLLSRHLGERPVTPLRDEEGIPSEAALSAGDLGDRAADLAAPLDDTLPVKVGDGARSDGGTVGKHVQHAGHCLEAGDSLEPLDQRAGETIPRPDRESGVFDDDRPRQPRISVARLRFHDVGGIERLRLSQVEVHAFEPESKPLGFPRLFRASRNENGSVHGRKLSAISREPEEDSRFSAFKALPMLSELGNSGSELTAES